MSLLPLVHIENSGPYHSHWRPIGNSEREEIRTGPSGPSYSFISSFHHPSSLKSFFLYTLFSCFLCSWTYGKTQRWNSPVLLLFADFHHLEIPFSLHKALLLKSMLSQESQESEHWDLSGTMVFSSHCSPVPWASGLHLGSRQLLRNMMYPPPSPTPTPPRFCPCVLLGGR